MAYSHIKEETSTVKLSEFCLRKIMGKLQMNILDNKVPGFVVSSCKPHPLTDTSPSYICGVILFFFPIQFRVNNSHIPLNCSPVL